MVNQRGLSRRFARPRRSCDQHQGRAAGSRRLCRSAADAGLPSSAPSGESRGKHSAHDRAAKTSCPETAQHSGSAYAKSSSRFVLESVPAATLVKSAYDRSLACTCRQRVHLQGRQFTPNAHQRRAADFDMQIASAHRLPSSASNSSMVFMVLLPLRRFQGAHSPEADSKRPRSMFKLAGVGRLCQSIFVTDLSWRRTSSKRL